MLHISSRRKFLLFILWTTTLGACGGNEKTPVDATIDLVPDIYLEPDFPIVSEPFGQECTDIGKECKVKDPAGGFVLYCVAVQGGSGKKGFCTRTCTQVGTECYSAANGMNAGCIISGEGETYCGFLCKMKDLTWACPSGMTCGEPTKEGQAMCLP
jgi:hypothetical protein